MALFLYFVAVFCLSTLGLQEFQHCVDRECKEPISEAEAILNFAADVEGKVSFSKGDKVIVYSKTDGSLWGVEVGDQRGFAPKNFLKEIKMHHKVLQYSLPLKSFNEKADKPNKIDQGNSDNPKNSQSFHTIDGTVVYTKAMEDKVESISPTAPVLVQSTRNENLKVMPTKSNLEYYGMSPHDNIQSEENKIIYDSIAKTGKETKKVSEDPVQENIAEYKERNSYPFESGLQGNVKDENEYDFEENLDGEDEYHEEEGETDEINEKVGSTDEVLVENKVPDYQGEKSSMYRQSNEKVHAGKDVVEALVGAVEDHDSNDINTSLLPSDSSNNKTKLEDNSSVDGGSISQNVFNPHREEIEQNNVDLNKIEKSMNTKGTVATVGYKGGNEGSREIVGSEMIKNERTKRTEVVVKTVKNEGTTGIERTQETGVVAGTENTDYIEKTVSYENTENTLISDNSLSSSELLNEIKTEIPEQALSKFEEEQHVSIEQEESSLEKDDMELVSSAKEVPASVSPDSEFYDEVKFKGYPSFVTRVENMDNEKNYVSENSPDGYEGIFTEQEAVKTSEEKQDSNYLSIRHIDHLSEVPETYEAESSGRNPNLDLPEQLPLTLDVRQGWFAPLSQTSRLGLLYLTWTSIMEGHKSSFDTLVFLLISGMSVVLFLLGFYYLEKQRRDSSLLAKISDLERELMIASQEKIALNDEIEKSRERLLASGDFVASDSSEVSQLKAELEDCKITRLELEERVMSLDKELESATETGLELTNMMNELLSNEQRDDSLLQSVKQLQKQLDGQQTTISTMNERLTSKTNENENLQSELKASALRIIHLEEKLTQTLENKSAESQRLLTELDNLQDLFDKTCKRLAEKESEIAVLQESLRLAECLSNVGDSNMSLAALLDVGNLRIEIEHLSNERDDLKEKLQGEEDARKLLEDHMKIVSEEVSTLRSKYEEAEHRKTEAQTRLEILSNYFKEKETQLQKELGQKEAMYIQKEGDALTTIEQINAFQEEIEIYKSQNEILRKEIIDQERSMKSQIAMLEKKVHENWVATRQAERRLEESKHEASLLRNRLTLSGRKLTGTIPGPEVGKSPDRELEYNGEMTSPSAHLGESQELQNSPMHYGHPASPLLHPPGQQIPPGPFPSLTRFLPLGAPPLPFPLLPPPGNIFPEDLRPPPLGRMSSPPPEPHSSFSSYNNSPPMSPHGRPYRSPIHYEDSPSRYRQPLQSSSSFSYSSPYSSSKWDEPPRSSFRPLHRDSPREPKGPTLSSGHSSESLDKGSQHSDQV